MTMTSILKYDDKVTFNSIPSETSEKYLYIIQNWKQYPNWNFEQLSKFTETLNPFSFRKIISKGQQCLEIEFKPFGPSKCYTTYVSLKNYENDDFILCVTGTSEDIRVRCTIKHVLFFRTNDGKKKIKEIFEIHNESEKTDITFQFDIDNNQKIFEVCPVKGKIPAKKYEYITVKFTTKKKGVFFIDLPCIIHLYQPIFIELLGINSNSDTINKFRGQISKISLINGYQKYMTPTFGYENNSPILKLKNTCIDFSLKHAEKLSEVLSYSEKVLKIIWDLEENQDILILPKSVNLRPQERFEFGAKYGPKKLENLHAGQVYGRGFIFGKEKIEDHEDTLMFPINIRYIGNSFSKSRTWEPQTNFSPLDITMPYCSPNAECYHSFIIKNLGTFPLTFQILDHEKSHFEVKPSCGIITDSFQILMIKFSSFSLTNATKKDKFQIMFNQISNNTIDLNLEATVVKPRLKFGENDEINFGKIFPGCQKCVKIPIFNKTPVKIKYLFESDKWFSVDPPEDFLTCFELKTITFIYTSDCDVPKKTEFKYEMRILQDETLIEGPPFFGKVTLYADWGFGKLCANPPSYDFDTIVCGKTKCCTFMLRNFSEVPLHYVIKIHNFFICCPSDSPVQLSPNIGTVEPGEEQEILVKVQDYEACLRIYCVFYYLRKSEDSNEILHNKGITFSTNGLIFKILYYTFYPTVQFMEICKNVNGPLFSKAQIWEYFQIKRLNYILRNIKCNETNLIKFRVPDAEAGLNIQKYVVFILKNISTEPTEIKFTRKKICDCELKEVKNTSRIGSFRKYEYDCPHRNIVRIQSDTELILPHTYINVKIIINYTLFETQEVCYVMHLSHNRKVELYFSVTGLYRGELSTFVCGFTLVMNRVFIGEMNPDLQVFWFYNNTRNDSPYSINEDPIDAYNNYWGHPVLKCRNPSGIIEAKKVKSLEFLFAPIAHGRVSLAVPFNFGYKDEILYSSAHRHYHSPMENIYHTEVGREYFKYHDVYICFSSEDILIRAIPTHCMTTRLVMIKNVTPDVIGFTFDSYILQDTITISVRPQHGTLEPGQLLPVFMKIETGGTASVMKASVNCHLVNNTDLRKYFDMQAKYYTQVDQKSEEFIINENGQIGYEKVESMTMPAPPRVIHRIISVTSHIIQRSEIDTKMTICDQRRQAPSAGISLYNPDRLYKFLVPRLAFKTKSTINMNYSGEVKSIDSSDKLPTSNHETKHSEYEAVHTVLSSLVHNVVYSEYFRDMVKIVEENYADRFYKEFKPQLLKEKEEIDEVQFEVNRIPLVLLSETLQILVSDCLLRHFELGQYPDMICRDESIRDTFVQKKYSEKFLFLLKE